MSFTKATRKKAKLRLALTGPSGSGKTLGALMIASGLGGRIAVIDTEHNSADLYADLYDFDSMSLVPPYTPERFIEAINKARDAGYANLIIDSVTHEWSGSGGCLELNESVAKAKFKGNTWSAWSETTPRHRRFLDAILGSPMNVIVTMRSKTETVQTEINGKKSVAKLGMKSEQKDGIEYEFTTVLDIVREGHYALSSKDRTGLFTDEDPKAITPATGVILLNWLNSGAAEAPVNMIETYPQADFDANFPAWKKLLFSGKCDDNMLIKKIESVGKGELTKDQKYDIMQAYDAHVNAEERAAIQNEKSVINPDEISRSIDYCNE